MVGALTPRVMVMVVIPSHCKQWDRASFEIRGKKVCCYYDLLKIEMVG
jgi:hypothetical protein